MKAANAALVILAAAALTVAAPARASDTLYGAVFNHVAMTEQVVEIDPSTGVLTPIGGAIADCCFFAQGITTLDPSGGVLYFTGSRMSDPGGTTRLIGLDTVAGGIASQPILAAGNNYNAIEVDPASGTIYGAVFDNTTMQEQVVEIDPLTGVLTPIGSPIADCCFLAQGITTLDPNGGVLYFTGGRLSDPGGTIRLIGLDTVAGGIASQPILAAGKNYNAIEVDPTTGTIHGAVFDHATMKEQVVEIDPSTGALTPIGSEIADCCFFAQGITTLDPNGGVIYFTGSRMSDGGGTRLIGLDTVAGGIGSQPMLAAGNNYNAIEFTANQPPVAVCQDVVVAADGSCQADASIDGGSFDPEGGPLTLSQVPPGPYGLGDTLVTLTVEDDLGLTDSCQGTVTVMDTDGPVIDCNSPLTITPPDAPISFTATAVDSCGPASVEVTSFDCFWVNPAGRRVDKTRSCVVSVAGATIEIVDSGGVKDTIVWDVVATDGAGNMTTESCSVVVVKPGS